MFQRLKNWVLPKQVNDPEQEWRGPGEQPLCILMVCRGNLCRSPTAEGVLRAKLRLAGLRGVMVDSAGSHGFRTSEPPDPRAIKAAALRGYDLQKQRARSVSETDFLHFHWILAMDEANLRWLQQRLPIGSTAHVALLLGHARRQRDTAEVPDPYYGGPAGFERVLDLVEDACDGLVARLMAERAALTGPGIPA